VPADVRVVDRRHGRLDVAGRQRVDAHVLQRPFGGQRLDELVDGGFAALEAL
jgi:hypothetical protein